MALLPIISGKELVKLLERHGFRVVRIRGSHHRLKHTDGRATTIGCASVSRKESHACLFGRQAKAFICLGQTKTARNPNQNVE